MPQAFGAPSHWVVPKQREELVLSGETWNANPSSCGFCEWHCSAGIYSCESCPQLERWKPAPDSVGDARTWTSEDAPAEAAVAACAGSCTCPLDSSFGIRPFGSCCFPSVH